MKKEKETVGEAKRPRTLILAPVITEFLHSRVVNEGAKLQAFKSPDKKKGVPEGIPVPGLVKPPYAPCVTSTGCTTLYTTPPFTRRTATATAIAATANTATATANTTTIAAAANTATATTANANTITTATNIATITAAAMTGTSKGNQLMPNSSTAASIQVRVPVTSLGYQ